MPRIERVTPNHQNGKNSDAPRTSERLDCLLVGRN